MALDRSSFNLFGIDLLRVYDHWRQGWAEALQWPFFVRMFSVETVRILCPDGKQIFWPNNIDGSQSHVQIQTQAVLLSEDCILRQEIVLPKLAAKEQMQAVELAVQATSPFPPERTVWGFHTTPDTQGVRVDIALVAREHVERYLTQILTAQEQGKPSPVDGTNTVAPSELINQNEIEVWAAIMPPIVLQGFGEFRRYRRIRLRQIKGLAVCILVVFLLGGLAVSPVLHKRSQVFQAQAQFDQLMQKVAPIVAERDALSLANERLQSVSDYQSARPDPRYILGRLSVLLPDTVYLNRFDMRGRTVVIGGLATNAAELMELLGAQPDFIELKAPSAISLDRFSGRESFTIEFKLAENGAVR